MPNPISQSQSTQQDSSPRAFFRILTEISVVAGSITIVSSIFDTLRQRCQTKELASQNQFKGSFTPTYISLLKASAYSFGTNAMRGGYYKHRPGGLEAKKAENEQKSGNTISLPKIIATTSLISILDAGLTNYFRVLKVIHTQKSQSHYAMPSTFNIWKLGLGLSTAKTFFILNALFLAQETKKEFIKKEILPTPAAEIISSGTIGLLSGSINHIFEYLQLQQVIQRPSTTWNIIKQAAKEPKKITRGIQYSLTGSLLMFFVVPHAENLAYKVGPHADQLYDAVHQRFFSSAKKIRSEENVKERNTPTA